MLVFPNAKINLGLHITARRPDGFHDIETCFYPVEWQDVLEIVPAYRFDFQATGIAIPGQAADNLCTKAWQLLHQRHKAKPVRVHLHKNIPIGGGLGGGSSDAAFMLKALNELQNLSLSDETLANYAAELGSDCAFFIKNQPTLATGRGHEFGSVDLSLADWTIMLVAPDLHISTKEAYGLIKPATPKHNLKDVLSQPVESWKDQLINDFEAPLYNRYPALADIKKRLYQAGATYAAMTGSGAVTFGLFKNPVHHAESLFKDCTVWQGVLN